MARSNIQPVSKVALTLGQLHGKDRFEETVKAVLRWIAYRAGRKLPPEAWGLSSFELTEIGAQHTAAVTLTDPRFWSARLDDADKHVPLRTWVTEISVGQSHDGNVLFGTNLTCVSRGDRAVFQRSVPAFVRKIATVGRSFLDNLRVETTFKFVSTSSDLHHLISFLNDPNRVTDCIVVALPNRSEDGADALIDPHALQSSLLGVSHVFVVGSEASFDLTRAVGKELSTFHSAVRIYKPGFLSLESDPYEHPLFLPKRIIEWADSGPASFSEWLIDNQLRASCRAHDSDIVPSFNSVRQIASRIEAKKLKQGGATDQELLELYERENEQLNQQLVDQKSFYDGLLQEADLEREQAVQAAENAKQQAFDRSLRIRSLESRLEQMQAGSALIEIPNSLDGFEDWCKTNLSGAVELVNKAFQAVRKSDYYDPSLIYKSLLLLKDSYVPMRIEGTEECRHSYLAGLEELQLEDSSTGEAVKYSEDTYSAVYRGEKLKLDRHLKGSNSRDRRYGFRVYFTWDNEDQVVVVGWLPTHLENRLS